MDYFIGVVPPEDYRHKLQAIKKAGQSEPHITVKAQGGLTDDLGWLNAVQKVCDGFSPFEVKLGEPRYFGEHVLYLSVESVGVHELHRQLVEAVGTTPEQQQRFFELERYSPHLTLGQRSYGYSWEELEKIRMTVNETLQPFPTFEVTFVRVYRKEAPGAPYLKWIDLPLEKER